MMRGTPPSLTAGLTADDRLGVVSPRYEDAIPGASAPILTLVTAFYALPRDGPRLNHNRRRAARAHEPPVAGLLPYRFSHSLSSCRPKIPTYDDSHAVL